MPEILLFDIFDPRWSTGGVYLSCIRGWLCYPKKILKSRLKKKHLLQFQTDIFVFSIPFSDVLYCILVNDLLCYQMMVID